DAGARGRVQGLDDFTITERVHLRRDLRRQAAFGAPFFAIDELQELAAQTRRSDHELGQPRRIRVTGNGVEDRGRVRAELVRAGHEAEVRVEPGRPLVVIAGAEVQIAAHAIRAPPYHQAHLRVCLVTANAVNHVRAGGLQ